MTPYAIVLRAATGDRLTTKRLAHVRRFWGYTVRRDTPDTVIVDFYCAATGALCDTVTLFDGRPDESVEWSRPFTLSGGLWVEASGPVVGSVWAE
jgi:hypothetical protein